MRAYRLHKKGGIGSCLLAAFVIGFFLFQSVGYWQPASPERPSTAWTKVYSETYSYHNYTSLVNDIDSLESSYPNLIEVTTAQSEFGIDDCRDGLKIWILRVTNRSRPGPKPEVIFIGGHHGNEPVSVEAAFYYAKYLLLTYDSDPQSKFLVDTRDIYIVPLLNPYGLENNSREDGYGRDMNRDYPFGAVSSPLSTVGASAIYNLHNRHQFITGITWHSGNVAIGYPWGCGQYNNGVAECPDDRGFSSVGEQMSLEAGTYLATYPSGRMNIMPQYGPLEGTWEDWAYGGAWDTNNQIGTYVNNGSRTLSFIIEISHEKQPPATDLGSSDGVKGAGNDGYVPKNIRMALLLTDLAKPYVEIVNKGEIPSSADEGTEVEIKWKVGGCLDVSSTRVLYGESADPINDHSGTTQIQSGGTLWADKIYSQKITMPVGQDKFSFVAEAQVDPALTNQDEPSPVVVQQSFYVNMRTNGSWSSANGDSVLTGSTKFYTSPMVIDIKEKSQPVGTHVEFITQDKTVSGTDQFEVAWRVQYDTGSEFSYTQLQWGSDPDPGKNAEYLSDKFMLNDSYLNELDGTKRVLEFKITTEVGKESLETHFIANAVVDGVKVWSTKLMISLSAQIIIDSVTQVPRLNGTFELEWHISGVSQVQYTRALLSHYPKVQTTYHKELGNFTQYQQSFSVKYKMPIRSGPYYYLIEARVGNRTVTSQEAGFIIGPELFIRTPDVELKSETTESFILTIRNVTVLSSQPGVGYVEDHESSAQYFIIFNEEGEDINEGLLEYDPLTLTWGIENIHIRDLEPGNYYVVCKFGTDSVVNQSAHEPGDSSEFTIPEPSKEDGEDGEKKGTMIWVIVVLVAAGLLACIVFIVYKSKQIESEPLEEEEPKRRTPGRIKREPTVKRARTIMIPKKTKDKDEKVSTKEKDTDKRGKGEEKKGRRKKDKKRFDKKGKND
jgi:hypothetical protein